MRSGFYKQTLAEHLALTDSWTQRAWIAGALAGLATAPFVLDTYLLALGEA